MGPLVLVMQLSGAPQQPPAAPAAPPPLVAPPQPPAPPPGYSPQPGPAYAPQYAPAPYAQPYPYGPQPYPYGSQPYPYAYGQPSAAPPPRKPEAPDRDVSWFVRLDIGIGPPAFSSETSLLHLEGYGGPKVWGFVDGGYLFHRNVGIGAWGSLASWSSHPSNAPGMAENSYFIGGEIPVVLGSRAFSFVAAPRLGYATGQIAFTGSTSFQSALGLGLDLSATSFKYHVSGSLGFLRAAVSPPGEVGRNHDYGGLYVAIGGTIDG